ncbi:SGNH/GDSL hydrolase family protein [Agrobacterium sp. NPDC090273]|uniref:SGNH/GDSL hydrolase family protein n=1 Tax=Agrobacterium sp. NPDC090273 TaxID=3363919 RepID=UPI00383A3398
MQKYTYIISALTIITLVYLWGFVSAQTKIFPYDLITKVERRILGKNLDYNRNSMYPVKDDLKKGDISKDILFIGDSHIELGNWADFLKPIDVANLGIAGETSAQLLERVKKYDIRSKTVVAVIGTNDLGSERLEKSQQNIEAIIQILAESNKLYFVSTPYTGNASQRDYVQALNNTEKSVCDSRSRCKFLNINSLISSNGLLKSDLSFDGIHMNRDGYLLFSEQLRSALTKAD